MTMNDNYRMFPLGLLLLSYVFRKQQNYES